jgi:hypothetical protein
MKSDVKPVVLSANGVAFTGRTRLRGYALQSNTTVGGSAGTANINTLTNPTTVSSSTGSGVYIPLTVPPGQTETLNIPEDGVLYIDGIGATSVTNASLILFIDK